MMGAVGAAVLLGCFVTKGGNYGCIQPDFGLQKA